MGALCVKMSQKFLVLALTRMECALREEVAMHEAAAKAAETELQALRDRAEQLLLAGDEAGVYTYHMKIKTAQRVLQQHQEEYENLVMELQMMTADKRGEIAVLHANDNMPFGIEVHPCTGAGAERCPVVF